MNRLDQLNKEISEQMKVTTGCNTRKCMHDFYISKMALAVQKLITTRTALQAAVVNFQGATELISDINTVEAQHIVDRFHEVYNDTNDYLGIVENDLKRALLDIGKYYKVDDLQYTQILADIEIMENWAASCEILTDEAAIVFDKYFDDSDLPFTE